MNKPDVNYIRTNMLKAYNKTLECILKLDTDFDSFNLYVNVSSAISYLNSCSDRLTSMSIETAQPIKLGAVSDITLIDIVQDDMTNGFSTEHNINPIVSCIKRIYDLNVRLDVDQKRIINILDESDYLEFPETLIGFHRAMMDGDGVTTTGAKKMESSKWVTI